MADLATLLDDGWDGTAEEAGAKVKFCGVLEKSGRLMSPDGVICPTMGGLDA